MENLPNEVGIFNPLKNDFVFYWDGIPHTLPAQEVTLMPVHLAEHGKRTIARFLAILDDHRTSFDDRFAKAMKDVTVKADDN